ncbi:MAG TPA: aspartyl/asparaginyl beta-hydroxylase domain-containing protein [Bryobacteraceae bacterium]|nr:aspartyl/asparaginyl beta-hydroxylase domain-containing protein [Bryobacteraceae bacterium]
MSKPADPTLPGIRFPFHFDSERLRGDLAKVTLDEWTPHYNARDYDGAWRGAALRSLSGSVSQLEAHRSPAAAFSATPLLARCSAFREAMAVFECPLKAVRLLSLAPGSYIREHSDHDLGYEGGELRIHIPIQTSPEVEFYIAGERLLLEEGFAYYLNVNLPHRVSNRGASERIHLVLDVEVNGWASALIHRGRQEGWAIPRGPLPPRGFEAFCRRVWVDGALREKLSARSGRTGFLESAVQIGCENGFDFHSADVEASASVVATREAETPEKLAEELRGWLPIDVQFRDGRAFAEWAFFGDRRLIEPFFEDSIRACLRNPFARFFRRKTSLERAAAVAATGQCLEPAGFIFHTSRCGSTLVAQMLASLDRTVVVSEASPIDQVIQAVYAVPDLARDQQIRWLRAVITALGQRRSGNETHYFVKLDSWHIHQLPLIRDAFPDVPWIFLFRDPIEIIASHLRLPGRLALPGGMNSDILGLPFSAITALGREAWCAHVLARICRAALSFADDPKGLYVNYSQLPAAVWDRIARHFGISFDAAEMVCLRQAACRNAKSPSLIFQDDTEEKRRASDLLLPELSAVSLDQLAARLCDLACGQ